MRTHSSGTAQQEDRKGSQEPPQSRGVPLEGRDLDSRHTHQGAQENEQWPRHAEEVAPDGVLLGSARRRENK